MKRVVFTYCILIDGQGMPIVHAAMEFLRVEAKLGLYLHKSNGKPAAAYVRARSLPSAIRRVLHLLYRHQVNKEKAAT